MDDNNLGIRRNYSYCYWMQEDVLKTTKPKKKVREWTAWATIAHDGKSLEWVMLPGDSAKHYIVTDKKDRGEDCIQVTITEVCGRKKER